MKTVRDIMSPIVYCVQESDFLPEAAHALQKHSVSGVPVVNSKKEYVGLLSLSDINARLASTMVGDYPLDALSEQSTPSMDSVQVRDIMTRDLLKIPADASLQELGQSLIIGGVHRLLVVDEGEIVGLVSTTDLIHGFINPHSSTTPALHRPVRKPYLFETELTLTGSEVRVTSSFGNEIALEPPPEFGGSGNHSSPEDLFIASISSCLSLTFADLAKKANLTVLEYKCRSIGRLEGDGMGLRFTRVDLYPRIVVEGPAEKAEVILSQAKLRCLVSRSSDVIAVVHPKIESR